MDGIRRPPKGFHIPSYLKWVIIPLALPFTSPLIQGIDRHRILWRPVILFDNGNEYDPIGFFYLFVDNIFLGSCWGLLSGYTRGVFFKPPPKLLQFTVKNNLLLAPLLAARVTGRMAGAGLLFDAVERQADQLAYDADLNLGARTTVSTFAGLTALAFVFKVSSKPKDNAVITACVLGGYLVGSKIAQLLHKAATNSRRKGGDRNE
ncbi:unnamed protein product [Orchesella dallaii]|uniref:Uncharacterized protein n=1 Tax=Orchesella dallaii TaxID=48710 RepID=A0ABP1QAG6_9HEXA